LNVQIDDKNDKI